MKIQGRGPNTIDLQSQSKPQNKTPASKESKKSDQVDIGISQSLQNLERAIGESGIGISEVHSNLDENRLQRLMDSLDRVEAKRPNLNEKESVEFTDRLSRSMQENPDLALQAFNSPDAERVAQLLS